MKMQIGDYADLGDMGQHRVTWYAQVSGTQGEGFDVKLDKAEVQITQDGSYTNLLSLMVKSVKDEIRQRFIDMYADAQREAKAHMLSPYRRAEMRVSA